MAITDSIKQILSVKIKPRHDSYSDQFSRIFMVKVMMVGALLVGLNWYSDKISCIIPGTAGIDKGFVSQACWINGLYVFEDIRYHKNEVGYYGIPRDVANNGMYPDGSLCKTGDSDQCKPMEKTFFLQYQYMTFVLAAFAALYYAPYAIFRAINQDMVSLKTSVSDKDANAIVKAYFNYDINSPNKMRLRILGNIVVKALYIVANVLAFLLLDTVLNGQYTSYGSNWTAWTKLPNPLAYDYMGMRESPKPGNVLLPTFAFCEVQEAAQDVKHVLINTHKFVCELSQHVLYQYVFVITWFCMVFGIVFSVIGLVIQIAEHIITVACFVKGGAPTRRVLKILTLRECEYLEFIRRKNMPLYGEVIQKLKDERYESMGNDTKPIFKGGNSYEMN